VPLAQEFASQVVGFAPRLATARAASRANQTAGGARGRVLGFLGERGAHGVVLDTVGCGWVTKQMGGGEAVGKTAEPRRVWHCDGYKTGVDASGMCEYISMHAVLLNDAGSPQFNVTLSPTRELMLHLQWQHPNAKLREAATVSTAHGRLAACFSVRVTPVRHPCAT